MLLLFFGVRRGALAVLAFTVRVGLLRVVLGVFLAVLPFVARPLALFFAGLAVGLFAFFFDLLARFAGRALVLI